MDNEFYKPLACAPARPKKTARPTKAADTVLPPQTSSACDRKSFRPRACMVLAMAAALHGASWAQAAAAAEPALKLKPARLLSRPAGEGASAAKPALVLQARRLEGQVDQAATAEGEAELRYGELLLRADRLSYDIVHDAARATGHVALSRAGNTVRGPSLLLFVDRFEGEFEKPEYFFSLTGAGGQAASLRFLGDKRMRAEAASYSSCPAEDAQAEPAWQLRARSLDMDLETGEGVATGAVLRFQGVPILAAPALSFPLSGQRKSGWLPPNIGLDNRSGFELGLPYYWNLAPQRDLTLTPFLMTRRGAGLDSEFRYLEPRHRGELRLAWLPNDNVTRSTRWAADLRNDGELMPGWDYRLRAERVSDDEYWKDLPRRIASPTPRLLASDLQLERRRELSWGEARVYARAQRWQALQGLDAATQFIAPYQRSPQLGLQLASRGEEGQLAGYLPWGRRGRLEGALELEYNRFDLAGSAHTVQSQTGQRVHLLGHVSLPMGSAAWWLTPKLYVNAASYRLDQPMADGRSSAARSVPGFSLDHGWVFERETSLFGRALLQTLEPRLMYVNTVYRDQSLLPNFDASPKDFTFDTIYTENQFSGVDRVSDAHQLTVGAISRWLDASRGDELLRLGLVQRVRFSEQRITPDGAPNDQRLSDVLLLGAVHVGSRWWFEGSMQVNSDSAEVVRTVMRARFAPGPLRTVSTAYRLARGQSEQVELAWQWPLFGAADGGRRSAASGSSCSGAWYSAGRLQYSLRDSRFSDSLLGLEYDSGCWILRVGAERLSTGRSETNTRLLLQLELVGLSRLGSNALQVLRDNIPGYRPLSSERSNLFNASYD